ncbi:MAG TPA: universal stress protein [Candidatus Nitrosotalea sp.]|nr:universal stress protein [Candidatus Nitrosotalea sp.]
MKASQDCVMVIKNILVPYEGSPLSRKALDLARDIARNFTADLTVLMVIPVYYPINDSIFAGAAVTNYQDIVKTLKLQGEKELKKVVEKCKEGGTKTSYKIVNDDVSNAILKQAKKSKTDMIIMGSRRLTGMSSLKRLGSTARHVSEHAECPVTIVH